MADATGAPQIGKVRKFYYDADGSIASPTWVPVGKMSGGDHSSQHEKVEIKERDNNFTTYMLGHTDVPIQVELTVRPGNAVYEALYDAHIAKTKIGVAMMTGDLTVGDHFGIQAEVRIDSWQEPQGNTDVNATLGISLAADYTTAPAIVKTVAV